jgi:predicted RNase H-like HicB family nuclease
VAGFSILAIAAILVYPLPKGRPMNITFETEMEADGRWIAEVPELAGVLAYGASEREAIAKAESLALRVIADRIDHNESGAMPVFINVAAE